MKLIHKLIMGFMVLIAIFWLAGYAALSYSKKEIEEREIISAQVLLKATIDNISRHMFNRFKIFQVYSSDTALIKAVISSNQDFDKLNDIQAFITKKDQEWISAKKKEITPFMQNLINNDLSKSLRDKIDFYATFYDYQVFGEVFVTNKYGANIAQTGKTSDYRQDDEEWWQIAKKDGIFVKDIDYDASTDTYSTIFGYRITDNSGDFIGVMKTVVNILDVVELMKEIDSDELKSKNKGNSFFLATAKGELIYASEHSKDLFGYLSALVGKNEFTPQAGIFSGKYIKTPKGDSFILTHAHLELVRLPWVLILLQSSEDILAPINNLKYRLLIIAITVTIIGILLAYITSRNAVKNIIKLSNASVRIGAGELDVKIDINSKDEIGQLAKVFMQMTNNLQDITVSRDRLTEEVNKRKMAETTILQNENRFRIVLENSNDAIISIDSSGKIFFWNSSAEKIFGYKPEEIIGKPILLIIPEEHRMAHTEGMNRFHQTGVPKIIGKTVELTGLKKDGTVFPIEISFSMWNEKNEIYFTGTIRDIAERKKSEELIQHQISRMSALRLIDNAIVSNLNLTSTLEVFLDHIVKELNVDAACILSLNNQTQILECLARKGFKSDALQYTKLKLGESMAGRAAIERKFIHIPNLRTDIKSFARSPHFVQENFVSYSAVPLTSKGDVIGVLEVFHRSLVDISPEWKEFLEAIANQGAIALDNSFLFQKLQRSNIELTHAYDTTIEGWSRALDLRDKETEGHSKRVTEMAVKIAKEFKMSDEELVNVRRGSLLHDIGKMGIPDHILLKPGKLTDDEWIIMKLHPVYARNLLYPIEYLQPALDIPYCHHEKWDGTGYPRKLKGEAIPLVARIFAVVDVWDALASDRPYRPAWPKEKIIEHISSLAGTHFDARVVEFFLRAMK